MSNFCLNKEDALSRVVKYELSREEGRIWIEVHEVLAGGKSPFIAIPTLLLSDAKEEYVGRGSTEEQALNDCLEKIKDVSFDEILPKRP